MLAVRHASAPLRRGGRARLSTPRPFRRRAAATCSASAGAASFRTEVTVTPFPRRLHYDQQVVMLGSCFADNFGARLQARKFRCEVNPFGIIFNPVSLAEALRALAVAAPGEGEEAAATAALFTERDLHLAGGGAGWCSPRHHSAFNRATPEATLAEINRRLLAGRRAVRAADHLVITLGTAWVYELRDEWPRGDGGRGGGDDGDGSGSVIVACCHKLPQSSFTKRLLSVDEMVEALVAGVEAVCSGRAPERAPQVVLTLSPVRHWKDGAEENARSKAALLVAAHEALAELRRRGLAAAYFPSAEILLDDLRDYRFYAPDMLHPSEVAQEYIWEKLRCAWLSREAADLLTQIEKLQQALAHKPRAPGSAAHAAFVQQQLCTVDALAAAHPSLDFTAERAHLRRALTADADAGDI